LEVGRSQVEHPVEVFFQVLPNQTKPKSNAAKNESKPNQTVNTSEAFCDATPESWEGVAKSQFSLQDSSSQKSSAPSEAR
jgi:hypothetical protein